MIEYIRMGVSVALDLYNCSFEVSVSKTVEGIEFGRIEYG